MTPSNRPASSKARRPSTPTAPPTRHKLEPENQTAPLPPRPGRTRIPTPSRSRSPSPAPPSPSPTPPVSVLQTSSLPRARSVGRTYRAHSPPTNRQLFRSTRRSRPGSNPFEVVPEPEPETTSTAEATSTQTATFAPTRRETTTPPDSPPIVLARPPTPEPPTPRPEHILPELRITSPTPQSTPEGPPPSDQSAEDIPAKSETYNCPSCSQLRTEVRHLRLQEMVWEAERRAMELERGDLADKVAWLEAELRKLKAV